MHFSLTYFSAVFLTFLCLVSASPVPPGGSSSGPSYVPNTSATSYLPNDIVFVPASAIQKLGKSKGYIFPGNDVVGAFIINNAANKNQDTKYHGTFVTLPDIGAKLNRVPSDVWTEQMATLVKAIGKSGYTATTMLADEVKVYKSQITRGSGLSISDEERKSLDLWKLKYGVAADVRNNFKDAGIIEL